jgi:hypothetical protein
MAKKVKQPEEELQLLQARREMAWAWLKLDTAITSYNLYLEEKIRGLEEKLRVKKLPNKKP